ncbi:unnamed protein product [Spirodela intermedia]|uniref:Uncharacterized protein n=1 Tax=Spirodela intermedia TaxID=51605 RepID=A0A7I8JCH2_SPIIN|nr:unnamed protein product [Spirodela intermedia]CAA6667425.1 unnamed protein product [Spirodela intermedia]
MVVFPKGSRRKWMRGIVFGPRFGRWRRNPAFVCFLWNHFFPSQIISSSHSQINCLLD